MVSKFKSRTKQKLFAMGALTLIFVAQSFPFAAQAQGLPDAITGQVEGSDPAKTTVTPQPDVPAQTEAPKVEPKEESKVEVKPEATSAHMERPRSGLQEEKPLEAPKAAPKKPVMLYGRLEEIAGKAAPTFPIVLKSLTPKMDQTGLLKGQASTGTLAGTVERSYPVDFRGTWGGTLTLGQLVITPLNYQLDAEESRKVASLVRPGSQGTVNFTFNQDARGNVTGSPVTITFMVPASQTNSFQALAQQGGGAGMANGAMAGMMQSMMGNMKVPIAMRFGDFQSDASTPGVSGNSIAIRLLSNRIKQLSPGIMEQQMITQENSRTKSGQAYSTYNENVFRFTQRGASQMYVEVAVVSYDMSRRFLRKFVFYGYVNKGAVQQDFSNPYSALQQMMGGGGGGAGGMQIPGMGGGGAGNPLQQLQDLQKMFGGQ
ncbi:MAG TPA: hypothetical protein EYN91_20955 [Candidatus Melainabacteria bacterium]|mgnify:CR=1 FL=1|nr:hypothetical protein [Candidatus Melainabacteria bacterium]HIN63207.1 hypothetical protein [Candidatus Obscuribacterales bacterium]